MSDYAFTLQPHTTAVLVIDMQNDFCATDGFFATVGVDIAACVAVVPQIASILNCAHATGSPVVYTRMWNSPDTMLPLQHRIKPRRDRGHARTSVCVANSYGAQIITALEPSGSDLVVDKSQYSAFFRTGLADELSNRGIDTVVVTGVTTNACVDSTARDAYFNGFDVVVVSDAVAAYEPEIHHAMLENLDLLFGAVTTAGHVRSLLETPPSRQADTGLVRGPE